MKAMPSEHLESSSDFDTGAFEVGAEYNPFPNEKSSGTLLSEFISPT